MKQQLVQNKEDQKMMNQNNEHEEFGSIEMKEKVNEEKIEGENARLE
jgi:hypothetical protein